MNTLSSKLGIEKLLSKYVYAKQYYLLKMDVCIMKFTEGRIATRFPKAYR